MFHYGIAQKDEGLDAGVKFLVVVKKAAELDHSGGISLQSHAREVAPRRYGVTQSFLNPERSSSYQSGYHKQEEKNEASRENQSPARSPVPSKTSNTGRWVPPHSLQDVHDRNEIIFRRVRGILNKLTPEKFERLLFELLNLGINSKIILKGIILLIFEKALEEPKYSSLYAQLCFRLSHEAPNFDDPANSNTTTFRRLLLSKCKEEFESRAKATAAFDKHEGPFTPELQEEKALSKRKMLGNIKFIGELGKMGILHEAILHRCIQQLLAKKKKTNVVDMAEDIECLCQIINTVGKGLDVPKAENIMNQYFDRMRMLADSSELPSRIKFMLEDSIELRNNKWCSRRTVASEAGPRSVSQMRWEAYSMPTGHRPPFMHQGFGAPMPFAMPPPHAMRQDWFNDMFANPLVRPMPPHMPGMFPQAPINAGMVDLSLEKDSQKDIFGKDPVPKNQQIMKKLKDKPDLFEPHYLKNKQSTTPQTLTAPASVAAQQLTPKPMKSYASASLPSQPPSQPAPPKKFNLFDGERFDKILKPVTSSISPWSAGPSVTSVQPNSTYVDSNSNQVSQHSNKTIGQQEPNNFFPFPRHSSQKSGQINLRPASKTTAKKEEEVKPEEPASKGTANAVNLIIKDKQEKPKAKKNLLSKPEYERRVEIILKQNLGSGNIDTAVQSLKMITTTSSYSKLLANKLIKDGVTKETENWSCFGELLAACHEADLIPLHMLLDALGSAADRMKTDANDNGLDYFSSIGAHLVGKNIIDLSELSNFYVNGELYPGFIKCLQKLAKDKGEEWLIKLTEESKVDIRCTLPAEKQSDASLLQIAKDASISFLFPVLCIQAQFTEVLDKIEDLDALKNWMEENMKPALKNGKTFVQCMLFCILRHVTSKTTLIENSDTNQNPDKELQEKEKDGLKKLSALIKGYLDGDSMLQIDAVYSLQKFCYLNNFPKGMLLRLFIVFYDLEIIEEDAYLKWKEDINDTFPGKGKALFQVNTWLQWLETADEEDESDEDQNQI